MKAINNYIEQKENIMENITIEAINNVLVKESSEETKLDFYGNELIIKHQLTFEETVSFVNEVVEACFTSEENEYIGEVKDFLFKANTIAYYTNIDLPSDIPERYEMVYKLYAVRDFKDAVFGNIDLEQYHSINAAIDEKIDAKNYMNELLFMNKITKVMTSLEMLISNMSTALGDIKDEDVAAIINVLKNIDINDEKIVGAVLDHEAKEDGKTS